MIVSLRDDWLRDLLRRTFDRKKIPPDLEARLFRKLQMIDDATTDQDSSAAEQSLREAARQSGWVPFDPRQ